MVFKPGNIYGVPENLILINELATENFKQRVERFKELVRSGVVPAEAKKTVIEEFKLVRKKYAGTPKWMTKGKEELIAEGFDYKAGPPGPKNVGGRKKQLEKEQVLHILLMTDLKSLKLKSLKELI